MAKASEGREHLKDLFGVLSVDILGDITDAIGEYHEEVLQEQKGMDASETGPHAVLREQVENSEEWLDLIKEELRIRKEADDEVDTGDDEEGEEEAA